MNDPLTRHASIVVIGAGQAGLSAAYHLERQGFLSALDFPDASPNFVVLDAESAAGGAWRHRWESLTMASVNHIFDLPGFPQTPSDPDEPSNVAVPRYFSAFEERFRLPILRPTRVFSVEEIPATTPDPSEHGDDFRAKTGADLLVKTSRGTWLTQAIINATGTWNNPALPDYPGKETFLGHQLHTRDYRSLADFAGQRVAVVGGGISALQHLEEISRVATPLWYTRQEPDFRSRFTSEVEGRETIAKVTRAVEAGQPTGSVVSYTGLPWTDYARAAKKRGVLSRRPMFTAIEPHGVREAEGSFTSVDTILWATGFKPALEHLSPLNLRNKLGGIQMDGTQVSGRPQVHLIGFGPSQSTVGANRAGHAAARSLAQHLSSGEPHL